MHNVNASPNDESSPISPETVVNLSPHGRAMYEQLIGGCSDIAGRQISIGDIIDIRNAMREDFGTEDLDFSNAEVMECFYAYLRGDRTF
jgi:hypothetical protein